MRILEPRIHDFLVHNPFPDLYGGGGFFVAPDATPEKYEEIRKYHEEWLLEGRPYFILNFLLEDLEKGVPVIRFKNSTEIYRKGIKPKYYSQEDYEKRLREIEEANQKNN